MRLQPRHPNFLELSPELSDPERSDVIVLPLPVDLTASWKRGTADGPAAIIAASHHIEYFDEETEVDLKTSPGGIATLVDPDLPADPEGATRAIDELAVELVRKGRFLLSLGGEHAVSFPLIAAHQRVWPDLCVLQVDAHADMRDSYHGSRYNHACPMRRVMELGVHVTSVGVRSLERSEAAFRSSPKSRIHLAGEVAGRLGELAATIVAGLPSQHVYVTVDLDGLDPSVVPAVGTPVPGGLGWYETLSLLRTVVANRTVIGADVVELCPREGLHYADAAAARLAAKLIAYWAVSRAGR